MLWFENASDKKLVNRSKMSVVVNFHRRGKVGKVYILHR